KLVRIQISVVLERKYQKRGNTRSEEIRKLNSLVDSIKFLFSAHLASSRSMHDNVLSYVTTQNMTCMFLNNLL
ncbi:hypothetical protein L9F63_002463, partial [Diploptera punctata]